MWFPNQNKVKTKSWGGDQPPPVAAALQLDARELRSKPLAEFHPLLYAALLGNDVLAEHLTGPR
jgi:hypothetical protein